MRIRRCGIFLIGLCLLSACRKGNTGSSKKIIDQFPKPVELKGTRVFKNDISLAQITSTDSLIIVSTRKAPMFHFYDKKGCSIASVGQQGRGPNELTRIFEMEDIVKRNSTINAYIYDDLRKELVDLNITASIDSGKSVIEKRIPIPHKLAGAFDFLFVDSLKFIGIYDDHFNKLLDKKGEGFTSTLKLKDLRLFLCLI